MIQNPHAESGGSPPSADTSTSPKSPPGASGEPTTHEYLTPQEVAELLQIDPKTVQRWSRADASMPVLRRGRVVRFHRGRLLDWLARQEPRSARRSAQGQRKDRSSAA